MKPQKCVDSIAFLADALSSDIMHSIFRGGVLASLNNNRLPLFRTSPPHTFRCLAENTRMMLNKVVRGQARPGARTFILGLRVPYLLVEEPNEVIRDTNKLYSDGFCVSICDNSYSSFIDAASLAPRG